MESILDLESIYRHYLGIGRPLLPPQTVDILPILSADVRRTREDSVVHGNGSPSTAASPSGRAATSPSCTGCSGRRATVILFLQNVGKAMTVGVNKEYTYRVTHQVY